MSLSGSLTLQDLETVIRNARGLAIVDMGADDYTMTEEESQNSTILTTNVGDGTKTLTWPSTSASTRPIVQYVIGLLSGNNYDIAAEAGGPTGTLTAASNYVVSVTDASGAAALGLLTP
jgi:hypothetical protein